jgi:triosephosphate isomerase
VKAANVAGFLQSVEVDGVLVGGASLDAEEFSGIARFQKHIVL